MIAENRNHSDIIQQISAVQAALDGVVEVMVHDLVEQYVTMPTDGKLKNNTADRTQEKCFAYLIVFSYPEIYYVVESYAFIRQTLKQGR